MYNQIPNIYTIYFLIFGGTAYVFPSIISQIKATDKCLFC